MYSLTVLLPLLGIVLLLGRLAMVGRRPSGLPPGPPTLPILGNIHLVGCNMTEAQRVCVTVTLAKNTRLKMPSHDVHKQFQGWAEEYGPIYSIILGTKTLIVISSDEIVKDLLDKRSAIYSDRQDHYLGQTLISGGNRVLMLHYGATWRMIRKMFHSFLNVSKSEAYVPYQDLENKQMLVDMLEHPTRLLDHLRRYTTSLTTQMTFGFRTVRMDDPKMVELFTSVDQFTEMVQGTSAAVLEVWPVLRWLPDFLARDKKRAKQLHQIGRALYMDHWITAKNRLRANDLPPCFCNDMAHVQEKEGFTDDLAAYTSGSLLEAGSETTSSTLYGFVQGMLLFPDVQRRAQAAVDSVVGEDRLPEMSDYAEMPYVRGCVKESLRWMPTTPSAFPHAVMQEDTYRGFRIPKGAGILLNVYTIQMDTNRHSDPRRFEPERYISDSTSLYDSAASQDPKARDTFVFGAGRRICPGIHVAERSLYLGISRLLWAFHVTPAKDAQGNDIMPDSEKLTQGFVCMPEEFPCVLTPRSEARAKVIRRAWEAAQQDLDPSTKQWVRVPEGMSKAK